MMSLFWAFGALPSSQRRMFVFPLLLKQSLWIPPGLWDLYSPSLDIDAIWCSHLCISQAFFSLAGFFKHNIYFSFSCWKDDIIGPNPALVASFCYNQSGIISPGYQRDFCAFLERAALFVFPSVLIQRSKSLSHHEVQHRVVGHLVHVITLLAKWSLRAGRRSLQIEPVNKMKNPMSVCVDLLCNKKCIFVSPRL